MHSFPNSDKGYLDSMTFGYMWLKSKELIWAENPECYSLLIRLVKGNLNNVGEVGSHQV